MSELADRIKGHKQRVHKLPDVKDQFTLDTIIYSEISEANLELVKAKIDIDQGETYTTQEMIAGIDRAMGTNLFHQITYSSFFNDTLMGAELTGHEHSPHQLKGSLHYDSYRSAGVMVNYTGRNVIGNASRILVSVDLAIQPRFRVQYQKVFGEEKNWWFRSEVLGEFLEQKLFLLGEVADNLKSRYVQFDNQINLNLDPRNSYIGAFASYEYNRLLPEIDPDINDNILGFRNYTFKNLEVGAHYYYSHFNSVYYPSQGTFLRAFASRSLLHEVNLEYSDDLKSTDKGETNGFTKIGLDVEHRVSLNSRLTGIGGANLGFILEEELKPGELRFSEY